MTVQNLFQKINQSMFENIDFDEVLDMRDEKSFDSEWIRVYNKIEELKAQKSYSERDKNYSDSIRRQIYMKVYDLCGNSDLASCISDDFGLICDSKILEYSDEWLDKLIKKYEHREIPYGDL